MSVVRPERTHSQKRRGLGLRSVLVLLTLLVAPAYALSRVPAAIDWRLLVIFPLGFSILAFVAYWSDKRRAEAGEWRVPESTLHFFGFLGGWPGAFLAQRVFRHKTSKISFQVVFWLIVLLHQYAAIDSLLSWRLTKDVLRAVKGKTA
jgi:uncharacterized membrane protein YsdA (DUF1294 family)